MLQDLLQHRCSKSRLTPQDGSVHKYLKLMCIFVATDANLLDRLILATKLLQECCSNRAQTRETHSGLRAKSWLIQIALPFQAPLHK